MITDHFSVLAELQGMLLWKLHESGYFFCVHSFPLKIPTWPELQTCLGTLVINCLNWLVAISKILQFTRFYTKLWNGGFNGISGNRAQMSRTMVFEIILFERLQGLNLISFLLSTFPCSHLCHVVSVKWQGPHLDILYLEMSVHLWPRAWTYMSCLPSCPASWDYLSAKDMVINSPTAILPLCSTYFQIAFTHLIAFYSVRLQKK